MKQMVFIFTLFSFIAITSAKWGKSKKSKDWHRSNDDDDDGYGFASTLEPEDISDEDLCACIDLILVDTLQVTENEICYMYQINDGTSTADYCSKKKLSSIILNGNECVETLTAEEISDAILSSPTDYTLNVTTNGGIKVTSKKRSSSKDYRHRRRLRGWSKKSKSKKSKDSSSDSLRVFAICFDASIVSGPQNGTIDIELGGCNDGYNATCEVGPILPGFCDETTSEPTTAEPTTAQPTIEEIVDQPPEPAVETPYPSTPSPVTPAPVTPAPVTPDPTTAQPTSAPTYTICDSDDALNVGFLLDESASVDAAEWDIIKNFVDRVIYFDISPVSSVKMWKYATYSFFQEIQDWTMNDDMGGQDALRDAIQNTGWTRQGLTMTWDAVNRVLDDYWDYRFSCTDGCETRSDLLFVVTDGSPTGESVCPEMTDRMSQSDVDLVLILINPNDGFPASLVSCLDTKDNGQDVYQLPEFDSDAFTAIESRIREKTCNGNNPAGPGERPVAGSQWVYEDGSVGLGPVPEPDRNGGLDGAGDAGTSARREAGSIMDIYYFHHDHDVHGPVVVNTVNKPKSNGSGHHNIGIGGVLLYAVICIGLLSAFYAFFNCYKRIPTQKREAYKVVDYDQDESDSDEETQESDEEFI